jgi:hypothetical protein
MAKPKPAPVLDEELEDEEESEPKYDDEGLLFDPDEAGR